MVQAVQQSLFEAGSGTPTVESARWIEGLMLGEIALAVCVIGVAFIGMPMLTGRLPLREGGRVVVGCFVLLGAPAIAAGFAAAGESSMIETSQVLLPIVALIERPRAELPPSNFAPFAGRP